MRRKKLKSNKNNKFSLESKLKYLVNLAFLIIIIFLTFLIIDFLFPEYVFATRYSIIDRNSDWKIEDNIVLYHNNFFNFSNDSEIVVIGDSFTYGHGVLENETYSYFLSNLSGMSVANYGVPGYDLPQIKKVFDVVIKSKPKLILYGLFVNDLENVCDFKINDDKVKIFNYNDVIPSNLGKFNFIFQSKIIRSVFRLLKNQDESYRPNLKKYENILSQMHKESEDNDIRFVIVLIPALEECSVPKFYDKIELFNESWVYSEFKDDIKKQVGNCTYIRISEKIESRNADAKNTPGHPTIEGHKIFAELIYKFLKEGKYI